MLAQLSNFQPPQKQYRWKNGYTSHFLSKPITYYFGPVQESISIGHEVWIKAEPDDHLVNTFAVVKLLNIYTFWGRLK